MPTVPFYMTYTIKGTVLRDISGTFSLWFDMSRPREDRLMVFEFFSILQVSFEIIWFDAVNVKNPSINIVNQ